MRSLLIIIAAVLLILPYPAKAQETALILPVSLILRDWLITTICFGHWGRPPTLIYVCRPMWSWMIYRILFGNI